MLRYHNYDIVFQEVPGEVTLAINLTHCPHRCAGCHSPHLREDRGETLNEHTLSGLLEKYGNAITCVCFMGGDAAPQEVERLAVFLRSLPGQRLKTAWYSGYQHLPEGCSPQYFDYIKLGPYIESLGGLESPSTNQLFYRIINQEMIDVTDLFSSSETSPKALY